METNSNQNTAALIHLSTLSQYIFPLGNFILPVIIWSSTKDKSEFIDRQGKHAINFQLSLFLYSLILCLIAVPAVFVTVLKNVSFSAIASSTDWVIDDFNFADLTGVVWIAIMAGFFFCMLKIVEFFLIIYAAVKTSGGGDFKYPLTISFIR